MKSMPVHRISREIFARCPGYFCRVAGTVAGYCGWQLKSLPVFQFFCAATDLFSRGTTVANQPLRIKLK